MEGHEARLLVQGQKERGDIAIADKDLWIPADGREADLGKEPQSAITPSRAKDGLDLFVPECRVKVLQPRSVLPGEVLLLIIQVRSRKDIEAHSPQTIHAGQEFRWLNRAGRRNDRDGVPGFQPGGFENH